MLYYEVALTNGQPIVIYLDIQGLWQYQMLLHDNIEYQSALFQTEYDRCLK